MLLLRKLWKHTRTGLISLCLMTCLTLSACNTAPVIKGPPSSLYSQAGEESIAAPPRGSTNADLVAYVRKLKEALRAAYDDRKAIRAWAAGAGIKPDE